MPLRWIEEREARRVLAEAKYDSPNARIGKSLWSEVLRRWVGAGATPADQDDVENAEATSEPPVG